ncbi:hypothetical protein ACSBR2_005372 [Camellia fascicularis]
METFSLTPDCLDCLDLQKGSDENVDVSNLCLVGKILAPQNLNKTAVLNIIQGAWKTRAKLHQGDQLKRWISNGAISRFRLGHDNSSCKFVSREEGKNSGYGLELRTSRAPRLDTSVKQIRHWVDAAEERVRNLVSQRPVAMSTDVACKMTHKCQNDITDPAATAGSADLESSVGLGLGPQYFVTEPVDHDLLIKATHNNESRIGPFNEIGIEEISPNSNPTKVSFVGQTIDKCMASFFKDLSIKRKAFEDLVNTSQSKRSRVSSAGAIVSSYVQPPELKRRLVRNARRKKSPKHNQSHTSLPQDLTVEDDGTLVHVPIAWDQEGVGDCCSQVPSTYPTEGIETTEQALVAGPQQPHAPC